uniref:Retrotransposon Copia-like N-terminal domain-containing protein n=1 Tax=Chenopodium quinoa TaxID=63459 RepID=A0A803LNL9_CHEQI
MATDANSVLYLHPNDGSYSISVDKLTGVADYRSWRRSMEIALTSKKKIGFVLGTVLRSTYAQDAVKADQWDTCNSMVISWIHACLSDTIKKSVLYVNSARETWIQLEKRFSMGNGSRKYKLNKDLYQLKQHNNSVNEYYTAMSGLWEELDSMNALPVISEPSADVRSLLNVVARNQEESRLFQFLNGLDDHFSAMRSQMLMLTPLPTVETACSMLQQEESQREVLLPRADPDISAMYSRQNAERTSIICTHCGGKGHLQSKLAAAAQTSGVGNVTFTQQQFEQLLKHFPFPNAVKGSETDEELDNSFSSMVSCHLASTLKHGWVIDSGASDHMTCDLSKFAELKAATGFPKITLPTGDSASISHTGNVNLCSSLTLQNVLCVPNFRYNLLSVPKLTKDSQCEVNFYGSHCVIRDVVSKKIRGVGKTRNGLYYLVDKPLTEDEINQHQDAVSL